MIIPDAYVKISPDTLNYQQDYILKETAMNFKDALKSIIKPHEDDVFTPLTTVFSENLDKEHVWPEYPR
ncbi:MAG: hypothetical protein J5988_00745, partial [Eubacterium sp.]|nr:hypothetical protein [Eubacterium sp.]